MNDGHIKTYNLQVIMKRIFQENLLSNGSLHLEVQMYNFKIYLLAVFSYQDQIYNWHRIIKLTFNKIVAYTKPIKNVWSLRFRLNVFIWRHVVYVPKSSTVFCGILICVIFRPRDMQEYFFMFSIALE